MMGGEGLMEGAQGRPSRGLTSEQGLRKHSPVLEREHDPQAQQGPDPENRIKAHNLTREEGLVMSQPREEESQGTAWRPAQLRFLTG